MVGVEFNLDPVAEFNSGRVGFFVDERRRVVLLECDGEEPEAPDGVEEEIEDGEEESRDDKSAVAVRSRPEGEAGGWYWEKVWIT